MSLRADVLALIEKRPDTLFTRSRIAGELGLPPGRRRALAGVLNSLVGARQVEYVQRKYRLARTGGSLTGVFHAARGGFGFITPDAPAGAEDVFVRAVHTGGALEGDRVSASLIRRGAGGRKTEARVLAVVSRSRRPVVGIVQGGLLLPMGGAQPSIPIPRGSAANGQVVSVIPGRDPNEPAGSRVVLLGELDDPATPIRAAQARYGLSGEFPEAVERELEGLEDRLRGEAGERRDLRDLPTVTIDPADARDFDDAISVRREGKGFRLWVHIADVSHMVRPGSALDVEALRRGNSTYLPGTVYPMLPHRLSSDLCSLRPDEDRLAFTVEMLTDGRGRVRRKAFFKSLIRSDARLSYEQAQKILERGERGGPVEEVLLDAFELSEVLFRERLAMGTLDLDLPEAALRFGLSGKVEDVLPSVRLATHRIVEEAMLLCNRTVAEACVERGVPILYRVHDEPDAEKLEALRPLLNALGLGSALRGDLSDPFTLQRVLEGAQGHRAAKLVAYLILRAMAQARYAPDPSPHFGLGFEFYCHFTSPIRRYPDLVVHRNLHASLSAGRVPAADLHEAAGHCSLTERTSDQAEREVSAWYQMAFLADRLGEVFEAVVLGFTRFGAKVELVDHLIEGVCPFNAMEGDFMTLSRDGFSARGRRSGAALNVGDLISVRLIRVDRLMGEAHFVPEGMPEGRARRRGRRV